MHLMNNIQSAVLAMNKAQEVQMFNLISFQKCKYLSEYMQITCIVYSAKKMTGNTNFLVNFTITFIYSCKTRNFIKSVSLKYFDDPASESMKIYRYM